MKNQKEHWNNVHGRGGVDHFSDNPTGFAEEVMQLIPPSSTILELGCGVGNDSIGFARKGHTVLATDFSEVAVQKCAQRFANVSQLSFEILDISQPMNLEDERFDVVYARLSLHYFRDTVTRSAIGEIYRVLKPNGYFCFICKSTNDPLYGLGLRIEDDMFEHEGHVRHFFSKEYAESLLQGRFGIVSIDCGDEVFYNNRSSYIKAVAKVLK